MLKSNITIPSLIKDLALKFGIELNRYNSLQSQNARLSRLLNYHDIQLILDIGANDGGYGRLLRKIGYNKNIISFEPLADAYELLNEYTKDDDNWHVAPRMAIGNYDGEIIINKAGNSTSSSILEMEAQHEISAPYSKFIGSEKVAIRKLDSFTHPLIDLNKNIFLKIDTQGYEKQVLDGSKELLKNISGIQIEMSLTPLYVNQTLYIDVINYLNDLGFKLWNVIPGFSDPTTGRLLQADGVFFKKP